MTSASALLQQLSVSTWFGALPLKQRKLMLAQAERLKLHRGEMLFRKGDPPGGFYALVSGAMKMSTLSEDGKEAILIVLESGTWFGEISLIDRQPRTHDATAMCDTEILKLSQKTFNELMKTASFAYAISTMLAARIRLLYGIVEDNSLRSTRARIARRLLLLAHSETNQAASLRVQVSQESFAMMLGITRQTLSKELKSLAQAGAIEIGYGHIAISSEKALLRCADLN